MSDTDDGFDEEAVREELREKYEDDRGETERMSELLLQGATMTNQHCDRCGNPIFRHEGQAFCPNCQQTAERGRAGRQNAETPSQENAARQSGQQPSTQQAGGRAGPADARANDQQVREDGEAPQQADAADTAANAAADASRRRQPAQGGDAGARDRRSPDAQPQSGGQPASAGQSSGGALAGEGAAALESSVAALARRAAGADDPRRAREFLEAAREAAEALDALRRNA